MELKTPLGTLVVTIQEDDKEYPCIEITHKEDGSPVAVIEYTKPINSIRTISYNDHEDDYQNTTVYKAGGVEVNFEDNDTMTEEQDILLESFYEVGDFIADLEKADEGAPHKYLWDNFELFAEYIKNLKEPFYVFTVVECDNDEAWILPGRRVVNRIGYFVSRKEITIPDEGIRYW